ncbi:MAG: SprT family zinc-dependent metalloprotease [Patescibacteria group bacterium]
MDGYEIKESTRARQVRVTVYPDGKVVVTKPVRMSNAVVEKFVKSKREWIEASQARFRKRSGGTPPIKLPKPRKGSYEYTEAVAAARRLATERLAHFNKQYQCTYGTISMRNQKTRWGSCTRQGNLSFNYRIAYLPAELADYIVVHELCHTREHNHSKQFWALVAQALPKHKELRTTLRTQYLF